MSVIVPTAAPIAAPTAAPTAGRGPAIDYNAFLRLLTAQMKNQDPTDPTDSATWVGQFAQFSQVEQALQTNLKLESLMASTGLAQAGSLIGRTVASADGSVSGVVRAVHVSADGTVAELAGGGRLPLGSGVTIR